MRAALLFDLDGTLLDTDPLHGAVFSEIFAERGRSIDHDWYLENLHGKLNADIFGTHFPGEDARALSEEKEARFRDRLGESVPPTPGLEALLARAADRGWGLAVVTNAPRPNAHVMLSAIGMGDRFDTLVIGDECPRGKPHPDPYLAAMDRLGADPARSLAFEDSPSGLAAAAASGASVVGLRSSLDDAALRAAGAHVTIEDFTDTALGPWLDRLEGADA